MLPVVCRTRDSLVIITNDFWFVNRFKQKNLIFFEGVKMAVFSGRENTGDGFTLDTPKLK